MLVRQKDCVTIMNGLVALVAGDVSVQLVLRDNNTLLEVMVLWTLFDGLNGIALVVK